MVANLWNENAAQAVVKAAGGDLADRQLALQAYASHLIGSDPELVQHGGGNTSCKVVRSDLFGAEMDVLHIKGSGHDLARIQPDGMPGVRLDALLSLRQLQTLGDRDMINFVRANMLDATAPNPSVEILLHAFLPHRFVNHSHATAMVALADLPDPEAAVAEIFGDKIACVPFHMPGFHLGKAAAEVYEANPDIQGLLLLKHGHFAFADDAKTAYDLMIEHTAMVERWLHRKSGVVPARPGPPDADMLARAPQVLPMLRGLVGSATVNFTGDRDAAMPVMDLRAGPNVREFLARPDVAHLARRGVATPDHVIRTKNTPLYLDAQTVSGGVAAIAQAVDGYVAGYTAYFDRNTARHAAPKTMLDPAPNLAWIDGVGVVGIGKDATAAAIAADLAEQCIAAMTNAQNCGGFHPVAEEQMFDMEYWSLEQAKLGSAKTAPLTGKVVLVTGGAGAIGLAAAQAFADAGANAFLVDLEDTALAKALEKLGPGHGGVSLDITAPGAAEAAIGACVTRFGGLDILVSNAGAAWTGEMAVLDDALLRKSFELNFFAHQTFSKAAAGVFETQGRGGQILFNVSKQAVNPGKGFGAYGIPKAATFFLLRQLALELGPKGVRVNGINADRIRSGLLDDAFIAKRSKARGIDEGTYMAGNLLRREVEARHVADGFVALAMQARTTAHVLTVDGGNIEAALR